MSAIDFVAAKPAVERAIQTSRESPLFCICGERWLEAFHFQSAMGREIYHIRS